MKEWPVPWGRDANACIDSPPVVDDKVINLIDPASGTRAKGIGPFDLVPFDLHSVKSKSVEPKSVPNLDLQTWRAKQVASIEELISKELSSSEPNPKRYKALYETMDFLLKQVI